MHALDKYRNRFYAYYSVDHLNDIKFKSLQRMIVVSNHHPKRNDIVYISSKQKIVRGKVVNVLRCHEAHYGETFTLPRHFIIEAKLGRTICSFDAHC